MKKKKYKSFIFLQSRTGSTACKSKLIVVKVGPIGITPSPKGQNRHRKQRVRGGTLVRCRKLLGSDVHLGLHRKQRVRGGTLVRCRVTSTGTQGYLFQAVHVRTGFNLI